jgi:hypothetical protein
VIMLDRSRVAGVLVAALTMTIGGARAADDAKYPDWKGQWARFPVQLPTQPSHDQTKPWGLGQQAPLTPEYQAVLEASIADQAKGGLGNFPTTLGRAAGMPHMMMAFIPMEFVVTPETTYILMERDHDFYRHIYTDGRDFPANMAQEPRFLGYSIGKWLDEDGDGRYDVLVVETRGLKGPRVYDATGIPLHADNETIINERIWLDKADPNLLHDDITTTDHALTRPWVVNKTYRRVPSKGPIWFGHQVCSEGNVHVGIGKEVYYLSGDGLLMPAEKDQPPPDLRYFRKYDR